MINKQKHILIWIGILSVFFLPTPVHAKTIKIKVGHVDPAHVYSSKKGAATKVFKEIVEAESGGAIRVQLYPAGQLGGERELIESTRLGLIQMSMVSGAFSSVFEPAMVLDIPYLFSSGPVAWKVLDGPFGKELSKEVLKTTGIRILAYGETGFRNFTNSKRVIKTPEDLKGLKIRVMESPLYVRLIKSLGAIPIPIDWPDVYTSLEQKIVDGQENPITTIVQANFDGVQEYLTLDGHTYGTDFLIMNEAFFQSLSKDHQSIIRQAALVAGTTGRAIQQLSSAMGVDVLKMKGVKVQYLNDNETERFKAAAQKPVIQWMKTKIDSRWIDKVLNAVQEAEKEILK
jgi:tripartite ATP-independent transporter DctP family solute receptor